MQHTSQIVLFQSPPESCSYLPNHVSRNVYADPFRSPTMEMYNLLIEKGFRRSGHHIYRPHCVTCEQCVSVRIPVSDFKPRRSQRRTASQNADLTTHVAEARYTDEYFLLYEKYLNTRHKNSGMDQPKQVDFERFLISDWCDSLFLELRVNNDLLAVAVTDQVSNGLSAVYTYFDPDYAKRSLGTAAILQQIALTKEMGLEHLYLGYWIAGSQKMTYKSEYTPQERYISDQWIRVERI